jgi:hypothetical protein
MRLALADPAVLGVAGISTSAYITRPDTLSGDDADAVACLVCPLTAMLLGLGWIGVAYGQLHKHPWAEQVEDGACAWLLGYDHDDSEPTRGNPWRGLLLAVDQLAAASSHDQAIAALRTLLQQPSA